MEKTSTHQLEELENVETKDLIRNGGILLDIEGRDISIKTAKDGHVSLPNLLHYILFSFVTDFYTRPFWFLSLQIIQKIR